MTESHPDNDIDNEQIFACELERREAKELEHGRQLLSRSQPVSTAEHAAFEACSVPKQAALYSRLLTRTVLWLKGVDPHLTLEPAWHRNGIHQLSWREGLSTSVMGEQLTTGPLAIREAIYTPPLHDFGPGRISLAGAALDLVGPRDTPGASLPR